MVHVNPPVCPHVFKWLWDGSFQILCSLTVRNIYLPFLTLAARLGVKVSKSLYSTCMIPGSVANWYAFKVLMGLNSGLWKMLVVLLLYF